MSGPPVKTASTVTGASRKVKNKKFRLKDGPGLYGTHKVYSSQTQGFKGGGGSGFGYTGSMMAGRSR